MIRKIFKSFSQNLRFKLDHTKDKELLKCNMVYKKYINHDTFIAGFESHDLKQIKVPTAMHVSVV